MENSLPSAFSITLGLFPSIIATHELVVPKSIPMTLHSYEQVSKYLRELSLGVVDELLANKAGLFVKD